MTIQHFLRLTVGAVALTASGSAYAFNPWEGADDYRDPTPKPAAAPLITSSTPRTPLHFMPTTAVVQAPVAYAAAPVYAAPVYAAATAPPMPMAATAVTPMQASTVVPAYMPAPGLAPLPATAAMPAPGVAPAYAVTAPKPIPTGTNYAAAQGSAYPAPMPLQADEIHRPLPFRANQYSLGVEGFYDRYQEPALNVDNDAMYIGLTGDYLHRFSPEWFLGVSGRADRGAEDYDSPSGTRNYIPQWEFEGRITGGYDYLVADQQHLKPYIGFGTRYYRDDGSDKTTNLGAVLYDRNILQMYVPVGMTYEFPAYGLKWAPTVEYGQLVYGRVNTHLGEVPGYYDISNKQETGYELRSDMLVSALDGYGSGWAFGPFIRYWHVNSSNVATSPPTPQGNQWIEPDNNRLQFGAEVKYLF